MENGARRQASLKRERDRLDELGLSRPTVRACVEAMQEMGIARELTGRERRRLYIYDAYIAVLAEGTEPLPG